MIKFIHSILALAAVLSATSCMQEKLKHVQDSSTVALTVEMPDVATKAIGDGSNVDQLVYAVYRIKDRNTTETAAKDDIVNLCQLVYQKAQNVQGKTKTVVPLELIKNQRYLVLFWAQQANVWFTHTESLDDANLGEFEIEYPTDYQLNNDKYDAFTGVDYIEVDGSASKNITLRRPFGQLNIATNLPKTFVASVDETTVTILEGAAVSYNVATGKGTAQTSSKVFGPADPINETFKGYDSHISMTYVFVPDQQTNIKVKYEIKTASHGTVTDEISNVPVAKNYRTNILGNLLTSEVDYDVTIEKNWDTPETNIVYDVDYVSQHDKEIRYTATEKVHAHYYADGRFGANDVSNSWDNTTGNGVITFDAPVTRIGINAFYERQHLTAVSIPNGVTVIEENAFKSCPNLTSVTFSENIVAIGIRAFYACVSLTNVVLPKSLTAIGESAFDGITGLKLYFNSTTPPSVEATPFLNSTEIYVPAASLCEYKESWGNLVQYVDQIKPFNGIISD